MGDLVAGRRVAGFAWARRSGTESTHLDDRLLLDGDEDLPAPPDRPVPQAADGVEIEAIVPVPPADLPPGRVHPAGSLGAATRKRAGELLDLRYAPWQPLVRPLLAAVHATGHRAWLVGGAVRDLVADVPPWEVRDLDLTGTAPPGRFTDIACQTLRAMGMSECRTTIDPNSLVCSVVRPRAVGRPRRQEPLLEYRGLFKGGFRFPVVGSRLDDDANHRDFAFNALVYDALEHEVFDASGTGLDDLVGGKRRFTPQNVSTDPFTQAVMVLRAAKLALRWCDGATLDLTPLDLEPLKTWIAALPPTLCQLLTPAHWDGLTSMYQRVIQASRQHQQQFAATLPEPGRELLETLIGRAR